MSRSRLQNPRFRAVLYLVVFTILGFGLWWGKTRAAPDLTIPIGEIFTNASSIVREGDIYAAYNESDLLVGWAGAGGTGSGYGGPMLFVVGIDTLGVVRGARVVEQRETPIFWRMARVPDLLETFQGLSYNQIDFEQSGVDWATGATVSTNAIVESIRAAVLVVASEAFGEQLPRPSKPFEFGFLEIAILLLFSVGFLAQRMKSEIRRRLRWASQISALVVIGFWEHSPITLAKITAFLAGYFPEPQTALAIYMLVLGMVLTSFMYGRNIYCQYVCPFQAAQRCVGLIGGKSLKISPKLVRIAEVVRNIIVFVAIFLAFLSLQPALASYEPVAALFSLTGTTQQWLLLFLVLTMSLVLSNPWCNFFCPIRVVELTLQDLRRVIWKRRRGSADD